MFLPFVDRVIRSRTTLLLTVRDRLRCCPSGEVIERIRGVALHPRSLEPSMKWTLGLLTPLLLTAGVAVTVPTAAEAAPLPAAYNASAVGRAPDVDLDVIKVVKLPWWA